MKTKGTRWNFGMEPMVVTPNQLKWMSTAVLLLKKGKRKRDSYSFSPDGAGLSITW